MRRKLVGIFVCTLLILITLPTTDSKNIVFHDLTKDYGLIKNTEIRSSTDIIEMLNEVHESTLTYYLENFVSFGPKKSGSENCRKTAEWIKQEFENLGLYSYFENWRFPRAKDRNIVAIHNGTDPASTGVIVICAHYDTIGKHKKNISPGATDDGSGIAAMLTIANITSKYSFNYTIRFIAVSGEEIGCYGSFANAKKAYKEGTNILSVLNLDEIGYTNSSQGGNYVYIAGPERSKQLMNFFFDIAAQYKDQINLEIVPLINYPNDHHAYNDYGYDGVWVTEYNLFENPFYHSANDTIDKVNFSYLSKVTKLILAITATQAITSLDIQVRIIAPREGCLYLRNIRLLKLPCFNLMRIKEKAVTYILGKITIKITITSKEAISYVYYAVDGWLKHYTNEPPYEYRIGKGVLDYFFKFYKGYHSITVTVITDNGKTATDEIDLFML